MGRYRYYTSGVSHNTQHYKYQSICSQHHKRINLTVISYSPVPMVSIRLARSTTYLDLLLVRSFRVFGAIVHNIQ